MKTFCGVQTLRNVVWSPRVNIQSFYDLETYDVGGFLSMCSV